jgi:hypothetical protein
MWAVRLVSACAVLCLAAASATAQVSDVELEYWRSVQRIDTPSAYRAYLDAYPKGAFAALAKMKTEAASPLPAKPAEPPTATATAPATANPAGSLRSFSQPADSSGEFSFNLGDRLNGPGVLTVGSLGAKKQIVLPGGEWMVLAVVDSKSVQSSGVLNNPRANVVALTTLVAAKFSGNRLMSMMRVTSTRQIAKVGTWADLDDCDPKAGTAALQYKRSRDGLRDECQSIQVESEPLAKPFAASEETKTSLDKLGARVSGAALVSSFVLSDSRSGYLGVTRIDWPGTVLGAAADRASAWRTEAIEASPSHAAYLKALSEWALSYRTLAADGFTRRFETSDLVANTPRRPSAELSAATDFDPAGLSARK